MRLHHHQQHLPRQNAAARRLPVSLGCTQLKTRLQLTPDQAAIVARELDDYAKYYQNIEEEREDVAEHGKRRIFDVLNPEQKRLFLEIFRTQSLTDRYEPRSKTKPKLLPFCRKSGLFRPSAFVTPP